MCIFNDEEGCIQSTMTWRADRPGIYDLWADTDRNGACDDQDIINERDTEAYPMVTVLEFNVAASLLLAALVFLPSCWSRTHLVKREVAKQGSNGAPLTSDPTSNRLQSELKKKRERRSGVRLGPAPSPLQDSSHREHWRDYVCRN